MIVVRDFSINVYLLKCYDKFYLKRVIIPNIQGRPPHLSFASFTPKRRCRCIRHHGNPYVCCSAAHLLAGTHRLRVAAHQRRGAAAAVWPGPRRR